MIVRIKVYGFRTFKKICITSLKHEHFAVQELATNLEDVKNELKVTKKKNAAHLKVGP
jgi:hypothetical protein